MNGMAHAVHTDTFCMPCHERFFSVGLMTDFIFALVFPPVSFEFLKRPSPRLISLSKHTAIF